MVRGALLAALGGSWSCHVPLGLTTVLAPVAGDEDEDADADEVVGVSAHRGHSLHG